MKKGLIILFAMLCATWTFAQNYGILVNGKTYYQASYEGPDPYGGGYDQYLSHVQVKSGDFCQLYDAENKAAWVVDLDGASSEGFTRNNDRYNITATGCYDFYIKLKWEADALYVGPGSNCGSGVDVDKIDTGGGGGGGDGTQYSTAAPAKCADVMLQAFYWDSYEDKGYGRTKWMDWNNGANNTSAEEIGKWFDLVWLPPMSKSSGGTGYHPMIYSSLDSQWGSKTTLVTLINTLRQNGARVVADIVINHAAGSGWCSFHKQNFGTYGSFEPDASWICNTDEVNYDSGAGDCKGKATGNADDGYGDEANYAAARDWDHKATKVQNMFKAYLKWLRNDVHVDGFRYDYCKGFHNSHINDYNKAAGAYFSVMEYWDGNVNTLQDRLNDAGWNTLTFDFATKYTAFNDGIAANNYWKLKGAGLPGAGKARYAVTFLDSHDTFQRASNNEFCGDGNSMKYLGKVEQCYAYMLSMPGVPCVFYPHWIKCKNAIKAMINARYKAGVHSESAVSDEAGDGFYKATITGTNGEIRVLIGPNSGYGSTPSGFTKAVTGENYGVYYKMNSQRGDKDKERKPQGIEDVTVKSEKTLGEKFIQDGKLYIRCGEQVYDMMGNRIK